MLSYILNTAVVMVLGVIASQVDPALGMIVFPVPVAVHFIRRRPFAALSITLCAAFVGFITLGSFQGSFYYALMAGTGFFLGAGFVRQWTYGWTVTAMAGLAYVIVVGSILGSWEEWKAQMDQMFNALIANIESETPEEDALVKLRWLKDYAALWGLGALVWPVAAGTCMVLSLVARWFRRTFGAAGVRGSFSTMRVSEWLVWGAIGTALLCFVVYQWPVVVLSIVAWNTAVGLAAVYWVNGLSVLVYALGALQPHLFVYFVFIILLLSLGIHPALCFLGLFDTWGDFRGVVDRVAAARKDSEKTDGKE